MSTANKPHVTIYTDGACDPNPGPGAWACLLRFREHERTLSGFEPETTNNRMELTAAIEALVALRIPHCAVTLYSDSRYVVNGATGEWNVATNDDLWARLRELQGWHTIDFQWVRGHSDNADNERVDALAVRTLRANLAARKMSNVK